MPFQKTDLQSLHDLVQRAIEELPQNLRPSPREAHLTASEYGHWSRRMPKYALVNIGGQRAVNPLG